MKSLTKLAFAALGVALLDRKTKPLKTTPMGRAVYEQCSEIVR